MNNINVLIGENLMRLRKEKGYNQEQLASGIGLTRTSVCNIENGKQALSIEALLKACSILDCELTDLLPPIPKAEINNGVKIIKTKSKLLKSHFKWFKP